LAIKTVPEGNIFYVEVKILTPFDTYAVNQLALNKVSPQFTAEANGDLISSQALSKPASSANKILEDLEPAIMTLKKITNHGLLMIEFSKEVVPVLNLTDIMTHVEIIVKNSDRYSYNISFTILNMTNNLTLNIQLNFTAPLNVSASGKSDQITVMFYQTLLTRANLAPVVYFNDTINITMQLSDNKYEDMVINAAYTMVEVLKISTSLAFVVSLFVSFGLSKILGKIKGLSVICTLYCLKFQYPALAQQLSLILLNFVQFDLFDCNPLYNQIFGPDKTQPYSANFLAAGYGSRQLVRIMGSLFMTTFCFITLSLCARILLFAKFLPAICRSKIEKKLGTIYWNGFYGYIKQNYIMLLMGSLLNITNINGWQCLDFNAILSFAMFAACIAAPISLIFVKSFSF
jgi:hypothetical protein